MEAAGAEVLLLNATDGPAPSSAPLPLQPLPGGSSKASLIVPFGVLLGIVSMAVACLLVWLVKRRVPAAAPPPEPADEAWEEGEPPHLPKLPVIIVLPDNQSLSFGWQLESGACDSPSAGGASGSSSASLCALAGDGKAPPSPPAQQAATPAAPAPPQHRRSRRQQAEEQWPAPTQQQALPPPPVPRRRPPLISVVVLDPDHQPAQPGSPLVVAQQPEQQPGDAPPLAAGCGPA